MPRALSSRLIVPMALAGLVMSAAEVCAQGAFPAPLPGQAAQSSPFPPVNGAPQRSQPSPFPPVGGADPAFPTPGAAPMMGMPQQAAAPPPGGEECMKQFLPLRQDAEKKAGLIKAAGARKAPPAEACALIRNFSGAEVKMIKFIETNARRCGIPPEIGKQMQDGHANTEKMKTAVCNVAAQQSAGPAGPSLADVLGTSSAIPEAREAKRGGATFETLTGNALTR
ncbi:hypothetical protein [Bradyrhizobium sp. U87765 SZCCT0109]|uniref:hypothetical protein n=1 Tax=Bradyrhizobium sp. U87765 SZCCT0109 TaxID=2807656 RepID=UPI00352CFB0F